ncbi:MAG: DUF4143 domain-containing protein [Acidobacteriota bacterium]|jgi:predicted AAA+ superfamily ATPase
MGRYLRRCIDDELDELMPDLPAISLEGPKAVGKTETALRRAKTIHRLDDAAQLELAQADPGRLVEGDRPILFDEWQRLPEVWDVVRRAVDRDPSPGQFLLTGSAAPTSPPTHTGAGRIVTLRMRPLTLPERGVTTPTVSLGVLLRGERPPLEGRSGMALADYATEIVASGFPGLRGRSERARRAQLDGYLSRIVDRDFDELGRAVRKPQTLMRWMAAYAAATATTAKFETIRDAATSGQGDKPAKSTTIPYRDVLERLWIVDEVPAWLPSRNYFSQLSKPPKHHLADPALAARLLGVGAGALLDGREAGPSIPRDGPLLGHLFESLVTLSVRAFAQVAEARVYHLRTKDGRQEVDLIIERDDHKVVAMEVKLGRTVSDDDAKTLHWLRDQIGDDLLDAMVVNTGEDAYRRADGIGVVPAALLGV